MSEVLLSSRSDRISLGWISPIRDFRRNIPVSSRMSFLTSLKRLGFGSEASMSIFVRAFLTSPLAFSRSSDTAVIFGKFYSALTKPHTFFSSTGSWLLKFKYLFDFRFSQIEIKLL